MKSMNNFVQLIGHLGKAPEGKELSNGSKLAKVSIATNSYYKNQKGEKVEEVHWHNLVGWGKTAELMLELMKKGSHVIIQGKLVQRSYEDKNSIKRYVTEVWVNDFTLLSKSKNTDQKAA